MKAAKELELRSVASFRRAAFGRDVCDAYGCKCAMCGIGLGLLEGAHIYPASAPGSTDRTWNGLALCRNHHRLFDRHKVWIDPDGKAISWHPEIIEQSQNEPIVANLLANTQAQISLPILQRHHPRPAMFRQRYQLTEALYEWAALGQSPIILGDRTFLAIPLQLDQYFRRYDATS